MSTTIALALVCTKFADDECVELIIVAANIQKPVTINGKEYQPIANASRGTLATQKGRLGQPGLKSYSEKHDLVSVEY